MGIPSYFSYIVKNHKNILKKFTNESLIHNLYLDSNSIVYDVVRKNKRVDFNKNTDNIKKYGNYEYYILSNVYDAIINIVKLIKPVNNVIIAFDGIAPVAKLNQQRDRRFKSYFINTITKHINPEYETDFDTTVITPGTPFMKKLDEILYKFINDNKQTCNFIYSGSNDAGEGEHKIFEYIRNNPDQHNDHTTVIYGLDADLIMLSLNHLHICKTIELYRETPEFIKNIDSDLSPEENYILDINMFKDVLIKEMTKDNPNCNKEYKMFDYIFMCFMLGNDFMPHFPAINIRNNGIDILMNAYNKTINNSDYLFDGNNINWKCFRKFVEFLSNNEQDNILEEYRKRDKVERRYVKADTIEDKLFKFQIMPSKKRELEHFINPNEPFWQFRYYSALFECDTMSNPDIIKDICKNYLEAIQWTSSYYTTGCLDWRWTYKYPYPPLLCDLIKYVPYFNTTYIERQDKNPVTNNVQLSYVLPKSSLHYLPFSVYDKVRDKSWYVEDCQFKWAFCKYFWESHPLLPHININELSRLVDN